MKLLIWILKERFDVNSRRPVRNGPQGNPFFAIGTNQDFKGFSLFAASEYPEVDTVAVYQSIV